MSSIATTNETSIVTSLPSTSKAQTAKEVIAANVKLLIEQLEAGHSEGLTAYLTAMGRFHTYSFGNILEIARQKPDATRVAGMYAWNQLGRKVIKGQKGIRILAPMIGVRRKKDKEAEKDITPIPRKSELDLLTEAETAFAPPQPKKTDSKKAKTPTPMKAAQKTEAKKTTAKKQVAA
jgi:hypothetical protein